MLSVNVLSLSTLNLWSHNYSLARSKPRKYVSRDALYTKQQILGVYTVNWITISYIQALINASLPCVCLFWELPLQDEWYDFFRRAFGLFRKQINFV